MGQRRLPQHHHGLFDKDVGGATQPDPGQKAYFVVIDRCCRPYSPVQYPILYTDGNQNEGGE